jgi:hypothetical protein
MRKVLAASTLVLATGLAGTLSACSGGKHASEKKIEQTANKLLTKYAGHSPDNVQCPHGLDLKKGNSERCVLTDVDGTTKYGFTAKITSVNGSDFHLRVQVDNHPMRK